MKRAINTLVVASAVIAASFSFQACNQIKNAVPAQSISFTGASADFVIPVLNDTGVQQAIGLDTATLSYNVDSMIKAQTSGVLGESNIQSVTLTSVTLTLENADQNNNFANFESAGAEFNTNANGGNNPLYEISYISNNPDTYNTTLSLPLLTPNQDLKVYFAPNMQFLYILTGQLRRVTTHTLNCHIDITYNITVKA